MKRPKTTRFQLLVLQNGAVLDQPAPLSQTAYTVPTSPGAIIPLGSVPVGPSAFLTYPANSAGFGATQEFTLYRYAGQALSGAITCYPVQSLSISDGFSVQYETAYEFNGPTANCDPTGTYVKYYLSSSYLGTGVPMQSALGRTIFSYQNGYVSTASYSMLDGLLNQTVVFEGAMLFTSAWNPAYDLPAAGTGPQPISPALQSEFSTAGYQISNSATLEFTQVDSDYSFWELVDTAATYNIDFTGDQTDPACLRMFEGSLIQSNSTVWEVFTTRNQQALHGGYARPTATMYRKDGVLLQNSYEYDDLSGLTATRSWSFLNGSGLTEQHTQFTTYGAAVYPLMAACNLLSPVVSFTAQRHCARYHQHHQRLGHHLAILAASLRSAASSPRTFPELELDGRPHGHGLRPVSLRRRVLSLLDDPQHGDANRRQRPASGICRCFRRSSRDLVRPCRSGAFGIDLQRQLRF